MSNRQAVTEVHGPLKLDRPHAGHLVFGVLLPALVIAIELASRMCADAFFDPMPTWWHAAMVALVPVSNLIMFVRLSETRTAPTPRLLALSGLTIAIAAFYALSFLPLLPLALVAILIGIGVLPLAPLTALVSAWQLRGLLWQRTHPLATLPIVSTRPRLRGAFWLGFAAGLLALAGLDLRVAATRLGAEMAQSTAPETRDRGLWMLRHFGDTEQLLRYCYDASGRPQGLATAVLMLLNGRSFHSVSPAAARETYYRVTGEPFNARPAPFSGIRASRWDDFARDRDVGGTEVAGRVNGLTLASSRIDGSISGDDAVSYLEWTFEFGNASLIQREARLQIALPPGSVVSRATLWVNGEEREAAFASRAAVRKAYENVVRRSQDPLLVTTKGADRVMVQAFPVPSNGTMKIRLGITAPLELSSLSEGRLVLPSILDRNFLLSSEHPHSIWLESKQAITTSRGLEAGATAGGHHRLSGALDDADLSQTRAEVRVSRNPIGNLKVALIGDKEIVRQEIRTAAQQESPGLILLLDGSSGLSKHAGDLIRALPAIPSGKRVGLVIAADQPRIVPPALFSPEQSAKMQDALLAMDFRGGADNTDGLVAALKAAEAHAGMGILWVHAPQPVAFSSSQPRMKQAMSRLSRLAPMTLYAVSGGPNLLLADAPWAWSARLLPRMSSTEADLKRHFEALAAPERIEIARSVIKDAGELPRGSDHIARLWAKDRILESALASPSGDRSVAVELAAAYQLVTPVSGAVVLETARQFQEAGLTPVASGTVPTVPEPHEWALLIIALLSLTWIARQRLAGNGAR